MMETQDSDGASSKAAGSPIPRRRTTRRTASTESLASSTNADDEASAKETSTTPVRRGRVAKTGNSGESMDGMTNKADDGRATLLPPPHPDLTSAAAALALLSTGESKSPMASQQHSPNQSVDESFKTPPESPQKGVPALAESPKGRRIADEASKDDSSKDGEDDDGFEDAVDEISDLSDVDDPHFTEIMSAKAASVVLSAAESLAGSVVGGSDSESDDDDEAPEAVTSKAPGITRASNAEANETHDAVVPNGEHGLEQSVRAKKKRRARHRKRAVVVEAKKKMATALDGLSKRHTVLSNTLPSDIPQELRLDLHEKLVLDPRKRSTAAAAAAETANNGKLDAAVLEQFAQQSKKRGIPDTAAASSAERKRMRKEKKRKSSGDRSSRVVSGIKVVASRPPSKANLLATLAQSVPDSVRRFAKEKHGGSRVERSDPLLAIARSSNKAAIIDKGAHNTINTQDAFWPAGTRLGTKASMADDGTAEPPPRIPALTTICQRMVATNIQRIRHLGVVPQFLISEALSQCTPEQLETIEALNPHIIDDNDALWASHCRQKYTSLKALRDTMAEGPEQPVSSWRTLYFDMKRRDEQRAREIMERVREKTAALERERNSRKIQITRVPIREPRSRGSGAQRSGDAQLRQRAAGTSLLQRARQEAKAHISMLGGPRSRNHQWPQPKAAADSGSSIQKHPHIRTSVPRHSLASQTAHMSPSGSPEQSPPHHVQTYSPPYFSSASSCSPANSAYSPTYSAYSPPYVPELTGNAETSSSDTSSSAFNIFEDVFGVSTAAACTTLASTVVIKEQSRKRRRPQREGVTDAEAPAKK
ncbi:hypothetical protein EV177_006802 [Coemansia sp. RSA 1804]|nr:hypothetical protein EV177_006802 [Coemansia sp. RSA 1804]